jgi:serine/threonine protein kinase/tetratricopeptide (TPR) repeat protein
MSNTYPTLPARPLDPLTNTPTMVNSTAAHRATAAAVPFPGYEILEEIGRGGMGVVYKARQLNLNRLVALKVILGGPHASDQDKGRFRLEAEAAGRLRHPNVVQVYDVGEYAGFAYIAFELVDGATLRQFQDGRPLPPGEAARLAAAVARAVHHAHENGIVHRDLKPGNILLSVAGCQSPVVADAGSAPQDTARGSAGASAPRQQQLATDNRQPAPKVTDFGLAKELSSDAHLTTTGIACGTPNYMSPEQVRGAKDAIGPRTDVYGLGAVLFEMLTGRPPVIGTDSAQVMDQILHADPPPVRRLNPDVPRDLEVVVAKCLERDPARRYAAAADVADDLDRFLAGHPIRARAVGPAGRARRWCRRNPWAAAALVVTSVGFAAAGGLAALLARSERVERAARADADEQRAEAEKARDLLRVALDAAHDARTLAEHQKAAADRQAGVARTEQRRAEESLRLARSVLRNTLAEFERQPQLREPAAQGLRAVLVRNTRAFARQLAPHAGNDPEVMEELHALAMWVAFMEYLNGNMPAAAAEYLAAADIARRWADLDPDDPHAPLRRADALTNAGRAERAAGRPDAGEGRLREAVALAAGVIARHPRKDAGYFLFLEANAPLAAVLRDAGRHPEAVAAVRASLARCHEFRHRIGPNPRVDANLAEVHFDLASDLRRAGHPDAAECHLLEAADLFDRAGDGDRHRTPNRRDAADARLALAEVYLARGRPDAAQETLHRAATLARTGGDALPLARVECAHAELLRRAGEFAPAEPLFDRAVGACEGLLRSPAEGPRARELWAKAATGRAHLYNQTGRHRDAAREWGRLAQDDPNPENRLRHGLFVLQSLVFAGDWRAAAAGAEKLDAGDRAGWYWTDLARVWCKLAAAARDDPALDTAARSEEFAARAVGCLERAKAQGFFRSDRMARLVETDADYAVVRGRFSPRE